MPAGYIIAQIDISDAAAFEEYRAQVPATIEQYGGAYIVRGGKQEDLEGHPIRAQSWFASTVSSRPENGTIPTHMKSQKPYAKRPPKAMRCLWKAYRKKAKPR